MANEQVNHLCESCQCKCKQTTTVEGITCPRYAPIPQQRSLLDAKGRPTKAVAQAAAK